MRRVGRGQRAEGRRGTAVRLFFLVSVYCLLPAAYFFTTGCADNSASGGSGSSDATDRAMRDPMHYRPEFEKRRTDAGSSESSDKDGFGKDLEHVLNP